MSEDVAVLDDITVDPAVDDAVAQDTDATQDQDDAVDDAQDDVQGDGRTIPAKWRALQATNPELFKEYKGLFFGKRALDEALPNGVKEVGELRQFMEEIGGKDGYETLRSDAQSLKEIDEMLVSGDAKILDRIAERSPEAIARLAPEVLGRWGQADPDGYSKAMYSVIAQQLNASRFDQQIELAAAMLEVGKPEKVAEILQRMQQWGKAVEEAASAKASPKANPSVDKRVQELDQRESSFREQSFQRDLSQTRDDILTKETEPFLKGKKLDSEVKELFVDNVRNKVIQQISADAEFQKKMQALYAAKNTEGAMKLYRSKIASITPEIAPKMARYMQLTSAPVQKPAPPVVAQKKAPVQPNPTDRFERIWNS